MSDEEVRLGKAAKALREALTSSSSKVMENFITWSLSSFVNKKNLTQAIDEELDILTLALNHYGLSHSRITPLFNFTMKMFWNEVENYLTDVSKVFDVLCRKPKCASILDTERGRDYLNRCCKSAYDQLYDFVWES